MTKSLFMAAAAAAALFAGGASAQSFEGLQYADNAGSYNLDAPVNTFCVFGSQGNGTPRIGDNVTTEEGSDGGPTFAGGDATFNIDMQDDDDNTQEGFAANFDFLNAQCNQGFTLSVESANGGLLNPNTTSDPAFDNNIDYAILTSFDTIPGTPVSASNATSETVVLTSNEARFGGAAIGFTANPSDVLLLEGSYQDYVILRLTPATGGGSSSSPSA